MRSISDIPEPDATLCKHIGYFMLWFTASELGITNLIAKAIGYTGFERMEVLTKGMDGRVKSTRLRNECSQFMEIGPNLGARLKHFESAYVPLRNKLSHRFPICRDGKTVTFAHSVDLQNPSLKADDTIEIVDLFAKAEWLNWFADDLSRALAHSALTGKLEISDPRTALPAQQSTKKNGQDRDTTRHKPPKKPTA